MAENNFSAVVDSLLKGMNTILSTKTVVGEVTKVGDTIILPLVDVSFGVGAGATVNDKKNGGGGGFSAKMSPSAVLVVHNGTTKLVNVKNQDAVTKILDLVPDVIDKITKPKEKIMDDETAAHLAFPEERGETSE